MVSGFLLAVLLCGHSPYWAIFYNHSYYLWVLASVPSLCAFKLKGANDALLLAAPFFTFHVAHTFMNYPLIKFVINSQLECAVSWKNLDVWYLS